MTIVTSGHDAADARLHREVASLIRHGLDVEVLALGKAEEGPEGATVITWPRRGPFGRAFHALALPWRARGRVVIALDPDSSFGAWLQSCMVLPRSRRRRIVSDVHEDYSALLCDRAWARGLAGLLARGWGRLGIFAATRSDLTVVADEHILPAAPRRIVLRNLPDLTFLPEPSERESDPRALYVGDLRRSRGLFMMLEALRSAPEWSLDLVGPVNDTSENSALTRLLAGDPQLAARVRLHGRKAPMDAWKLARGAWAGLLLLEDTPAFREALPSKLFEYTACGLAVLSTPLPRSTAALQQWGNGAIASTADEAAAQLREWSSSPNELEQRRSAARVWRESNSTFPADLEEFALAVHQLTGANA